MYQYPPKKCKSFFTQQKTVNIHIEPADSTDEKSSDDEQLKESAKDRHITSSLEEKNGYWSVVAKRITSTPKRNVIHILPCPRNI